MERESELRKVIERVKSDVRSLTDEARQTVDEFRETIREAIPRPLRQRLQKKVDKILFGRRRRR